MKKITLLLAAAFMLAGGAFAEGKSCCKKKGEKCHKEGSCCKDKKGAKKECHKGDANEEKKDAPKSNS
jgi:hypothetical protein